MRVRWTAAAVPRRVSRQSRRVPPSPRMSFTWTDIDIATITYRTNGGHIESTEQRRVCTVKGFNLGCRFAAWIRQSHHQLDASFCLVSVALGFHKYPFHYILRSHMSPR